MLGTLRQFKTEIFQALADPTRKAGNQVFYSLLDRLMIEVLDLMRGYFHAHPSEALAMLQEMETLRWS
jgi:hypothetical protein